MSERSRSGSMLLEVCAAALSLALLATACTTSRNTSAGGSSGSGESSASMTPHSVRNLKLAWTASIGGVPSHTSVPGVSSRGPSAPFAPTVADGIVYVGTMSGKLVVFSASCGSGGNGCEPLWVGDTRSAIRSPATVADGIVYVGTKSGKLFAFSASCGSGGASCKPQWVAEIGGVGEIGGTAGSPVVAAGIVYAVDGEAGTLYAFAANCGTGNQTCEPLWTARMPGEISGPAVADGVVYAAGGFPKQGAGLYAFDAQTGRRLWVGAVPNAGIYGSTGPVVQGGRVFMTFGSNTLYTFPASCGTAGGATCSPQWTGSVPSGAGVGGEPTVGGAYGVSLPIVSGDLVYVESWDLSSGTLQAFGVDCGTGGVECQPRWTAYLTECCADAAADAGSVYLSSYRGGIVEAYPTACDTVCSPLWRFVGADGPKQQLNDAYHPWLRTQPIAVDGVVFGAKHFEGLRGDELYALPASCGTDTAYCTPVWTWTGPPGTAGVSSGDLSSPVVVDGLLFTASSNGQLYAFALADVT